MTLANRAAFNIFHKMDIRKLSDGAQQFKVQIERAITGRMFGNRLCENGQKAKEALIRSQKLIGLIHELVKDEFSDILGAQRRPFRIHPPLGSSGPELSIAGFIKKKNQDVVVLFDNDRPAPETIADGPLAGQVDGVGKATSERSIVVGVRSQMSSVAKNFDTLMERAFAETLNLRLRMPKVVMGEVYLLPVYEYDDVAMCNNTIAFKRKPVPVSNFIRTFLAISGRAPNRHADELYKYERTALVLVDFRPKTAKVYTTTSQLIADGLIPHADNNAYEALSPLKFAEDLIRVHAARHR